MSDARVTRSVVPRAEERFYEHEDRRARRTHREARALRDILRHPAPERLQPVEHRPARIRPRPRRPRRVPLHAWRPTQPLPRQTVDDAAVRGLRDGRGVERALQVSTLAGDDGPLRRLRPADADWP